ARTWPRWTRSPSSTLTLLRRPLSSELTRTSSLEASTRPGAAIQTAAVEAGAAVRLAEAARVISRPRSSKDRPAAPSKSSPPATRVDFRSIILLSIALLLVFTLFPQQPAAQPAAQETLPKRFFRPPDGGSGTQSPARGDRASR